jgi:hypothetical protein
MLMASADICLPERADGHETRLWALQAERSMFASSRGSTRARRRGVQKERAIRERERSCPRESAAHLHCGERDLGDFSRL